MRYIYLHGKAGEYANYVRALTAAGALVCLSRDLDKAAACDGLVLPGGGDVAPWRYGQGDRGCRNVDEERDRAELWLLDRFATMGKPVLGICRGLQIVNVFFGGTLVQDLPGHSAAGSRDRLHRVRTAPGAPGALYGPASVVNSAHHQAADRLGGGVEAVQWAPDGTVEALRHRRLPVWAVQWHPERLAGPLALAGAADGGRLMAMFLALCR